MTSANNSNESEQLTIDESLQKLQPPSMYAVILHNDDFTPMDFVVEILQKFFAMREERATEIMLAVHYEGKAVCGIYTADIAQTKALLVNQYAKDNQYPLLCSCEKA